MLGERFRVARARKNLTLRDVAGLCNCSAQAVHKWEDGSQLPNSARLMAFVQITDVSVEWLLDPEPLDFKSTSRAPDGKDAKYWVRAALAELHEQTQASASARGQP